MWNIRQSNTRRYYSSFFFFFIIQRQKIILCNKEIHIEFMKLIIIKLNSLSRSIKKLPFDELIIFTKIKEPVLIITFFSLSIQ